LPGHRQRVARGRRDRTRLRGCAVARLTATPGLSQAVATGAITRRTRSRDRPELEHAHPPAPGRQLPRYDEELLPGSSRALLRGVGHVPSLEQPDRVATMIRDFVDRHRVTGRATD